MSSRIFVTGVSGYIGGQTVKALVEKHPDYEIIALVRNEQQAGAVKATWPHVTTVIGDLDSKELLAQEGAKADVVLQMASSYHIATGCSIIEGMAAGKKGHFVHTSGTGILHEVPNGYGNPSQKQYSDVDDIGEILSLDLSGIHRDSDAAIIAAGEKHGVPTAIMCPPTVYGVGEGPLKKRSLQIPFFIDAFLKRGKGFTIGAGNNTWDNIHIQDLALAYVLLVEEALKGANGSATWSREGYYFATAAEHKWGEVAREIAKIAHERGALPTPDIDELSVEAASEIHPLAPLGWGGNCRSRPDRLHALGWKASGPSLFECLPEMVDVELQAAAAQSSATTLDSRLQGTSKS